MQDKRYTVSVRTLVLAGLFLRLVLLPFFAHLDLLTDYQIAHQTACDGRLPTDINGGIYCFSVIHYVHSAWLFVVSIPFPSLCDIWFEPWGAGDSPGMTTMADWFALISHRDVFMLLFFLKLLYLFFDFAALYMLVRVEDAGVSRRGLALFWLFNPVGLFVTCVFGRYEVIPVFFIIWSIVHLSRHRVRTGAILLGIALVMKLYAMLFVPLLVVVMARSVRERLALLFWAFSPGILIILMAIVSGMFSQFSGFATLPHNDYITGLSLLVHPNDEERFVDLLFPFIVAYGLLFLFAERRMSDWRGYRDAVFIMLNLLFALSFFHPHYFYWLLPFWALRISDDRRNVWYFLGQVACLFIYSFRWGNPLFHHLAGPLAPHFFFSLPSPWALIDLVYPAAKLVNLFRSLLSALCLFIVIQTLVPYFRARSVRPPD